MLSDDLGKMSYSIGADVGTNLAKNGITEIKPEALVEGLVDALKGKGFKIDTQEGNKIIQEIMNKAQEVASKDTKETGDAFLAENKNREGVVTLESGLQYEVIKEGKGAKPKLIDAVTAHYVGTLIDGTKFDSSVDRGEPVTFPLKNVIPGWVEALQLMPVGSKWKIYLPSNLGYGATPPPGNAIKPHSVLIFEVELMAIADVKR